MRIALLIERFDPLHGGAEMYATRLARALVDAGHSVCVFCRQAPPDPGPVTVCVLKTSGGRTARILGFAQACAEAVGKEKFDVVAGLGRTLGQDVLIPPGGTVRAAREGTLRSLSGPLTRLMRRIEWAADPANHATLDIERRQFNPATASHYVANSRRVADDVRRDYPAAADRLHVIPTGVDTDSFSPDSCSHLRDGSRQMLGLRPDQLTVLFVAHNFRLKGLVPLLRACALLSGRVQRPFRLLVAGHGKEKEFAGLARRVRSRGSVQFIGATRDMPALYAAADLVAHPSFYDPASNVVLEACACGRAVLMSPYDGSAEVADRAISEWVLHDPSDVVVLADKLEALFDDATREDLGSRLRRAVQDRTLAAQAAQLIQLFERIRKEKS